ncbi:tetratricopeptide repeat-containing sensor histidine kinase [Psychroserpens luteolus]|uniref:tetratricopeptide repeat-containing sensor histidine kinase n=1 Tax=Psychroserpens luteolus TaxID=2855840 RepID=UPI001E52A587|nr:sensor histidine kinase [Psychroserpens luteolus]MCD2259451.1 sensor histidine kinase [Psychroserpens luteolus]
MSKTLKSLFFIVIILWFIPYEVTAKVEINKLSNQIWNKSQVKDIDTTRVKLEQMLKDATVDTTKARLMYRLGVYLWEIDSFKSEHYFMEAVETLNNASSEHSELLGDTYRYLAALYTDKGRYTEAMVHYSKAKNLLEKYKDSIAISNIYHNISILHRYQGNREEQKRNIEAAIAINEKLNEPEGLGHNYKIFGEFYSNLNVPDSALFYFEKSRHNFNLINDEFGLYSLKGIIADFYLKQGDYKKCITLFKECLHYFRNKDVKGFQSIYASKIAGAYMVSEDYNKALIYNKQSLDIALTEDYKQWISAGYLQNSEIQEQLQNYKLAYQSAKLHKIYSDSVFNKENTRKIKELELRNEFQKEKELSDAQIETLAAKNKVKTQWLMFGGIAVLIVFIIVYLFKAREFANRKKKMQEKFSRGLIKEQEKERARLARDLHDSVGQKLMLLSKQSKTIGDSKIESLATTTLEEVRDISRGLHPSNLERLGLTESINALVYNINANTELFFTDRIDNIDNVMTKESELHIYRIIQETLSNIVKHSEAKAVKMEVDKMKHAINITVSDNGKGFDFESKYKSMSLGLKTLLERAKMIGAQLNLDSRIDRGTVMTLNIPI